MRGTPKDSLVGHRPARGLLTPQEAHRRSPAKDLVRARHAVRHEEDTCEDEEGGVEEESVDGGEDRGIGDGETSFPASPVNIGRLCVCVCEGAYARVCLCLCSPSLSPPPAPHPLCVLVCVGVSSGVCVGDCSNEVMAEAALIAS